MLDTNTSDVTEYCSVTTFKYKLQH